MIESDMMHGRDWQGEDLTGWYLVEKLDGCRGEWDGSQFWSKNGRVIQVPERIRAAMTAEPVSGEFYAGRGRFQQASNAVRIGGHHWEGVEFVPFDFPSRAGDYRDRIGAPLAVCKSNKHALKLMASIIAAGGEGIMAYKPGVAWNAGRSNAILKLKEGQ